MKETKNIAQLKLKNISQESQQSIKCNIKKVMSNQEISETVIMKQIS